MRQSQYTVPFHIQCESNAPIFAQIRWELTEQLLFSFWEPLAAFCSCKHQSTHLDSWSNSHTISDREAVKRLQLFAPLTKRDEFHQPLWQGYLWFPRKLVSAPSERLVTSLVRFNVTDRGSIRFNVSDDGSIRFNITDDGSVRFNVTDGGSIRFNVTDDVSVRFQSGLMSLTVQNRAHYQV